MGKIHGKSMEMYMRASGKMGIEKGMAGFTFRMGEFLMVFTRTIRNMGLLRSLILMDK